MLYIDSHAHIDGDQYDADRDEVMARARAANVGIILNIGTGDPHAGNLERAVAVAGEYEDVFAAIGVHPHDARLFDEAVADKIRLLARDNSRVLALGEIGLDYHYDYSPREIQREVFITQLRMARAVGLPVIIHSREADNDLVGILGDEWRGSEGGGIMHCFGGSLDTARVLIELGFLISFAGNLTFKNAESLRGVACALPLDKLLIETDCPYLTPVPYRGRRNEPARVVEVAGCLAELHHTDTAEIGHLTSDNFLRLFGLRINAPASLSIET